jgi:transposase
MSVPISGDNFRRHYSIVADARRRWSEEEKQAIVAEAAFPGANVEAEERLKGCEAVLDDYARRVFDAHDENR